MLRAFAEFLLWISGWKMDKDVPPEAQRSVMIAAPHTTNWDFYYTMLAFFTMGIPVKFTIKKAWMKFPLNLFMGPMGGLPIDRSPKKPGEERRSNVEAMADLFSTRKRIAMLVTPEGTRKRVTQWKLGFYYTALKAEVPITLGYLDYQKKIAGVGKAVYPSGNLEADMGVIMNFYRDIAAKFPEKFCLDERFDDQLEK